MEAENKAFEDYYLKIWGERWAGLRESFLRPAVPVPYGKGLVKPYLMDGASVLAAASLRLPQEGVILDACAAPGGKSLVIASLMADGASLLSNELSGERRRRLANVLDGHLPDETRRRVKVSGFDAAAQGRRKTEMERFGAILLDVPCSSERHVIQDRKAYMEWKRGRPASLAVRQWSLLSAAFLLLKPGGSLVYSTCAVTPEENDYPPSRLLEKYRGRVEIDETGFEAGEKTKYGKIILPDVCGGMGPMFVARFRKNN